MSNRLSHPQSSSLKIGLQLLLVFILLGFLAFGLAWISNRDPAAITTSPPLPDFQSWAAFMIVCVLGAGILYLGWDLVQRSEQDQAVPRLPVWLAWLLAGAALLRLGMGVVWSITLPNLGHGTPQEMAGYVMADAYERDQAAWDWAESGKPAWKAFQGNRKADQYGGLLWISSLVYRYSGAESHPPLLMVVLTAACSALAVLFTWAFARRTWDDKVAQWAAWGIVLYPEVVLLGSSQMREAFIIPLVAAAFYGLARLRRNRTWTSLAWILTSVILALFISPPITVLLVAALLIAAIAVKDDLLQRSVIIPRWTWIILIILIIAVLTGAWLALRQFSPPDMSNPIDVFSWWIRKSTDLQAHFSKSASGWVQKIFRNTPEWTHIPFLLGYGVLRPFLPAALVVPSDAPIWPLITLWRALGWTVILGLLFYAFLRLWRKDTDAFTRALVVIVWLTILIASLRGGGDQDDNPRYRATFACLQVGLAAWAWVEQKRTADPIFRRVLVTVAFILFWTLTWYLRRMYQIPWAVAEPLKAVGLGLACGVLYSLWDWAGQQRKLSQ